MRNGNYAIYLGKEYSSGTIKSGKLVLRSSDKEDCKNGFEFCEPFELKRTNENIVCIKYVEPSEVEAYYSINTKALYNGYEFFVLEEEGNKISIIAMTGDYRVWESMGMRCIDKGIYQKWINKGEAEIFEEKEQLL